MLKQRSEQIQVLVRGTDIAVCVAAFFAAYWLRASVLKDGGIEDVATYSWLFGASLVIHFLIYPYFGFYESLRLKSIQNIILMVIRAFVAEFFVLGALVFFFQAKTTSRYFFGLFLAINYGLVLFEKLSARILLSSIRRRGYNFRQVLVVGTGSNAARLLSVLKNKRHWGYLPAGLLKANGDENVTEVDGVPVIGSCEELKTIIENRPIDEVYFAMDRIDARELDHLFLLCETLGIPARLALGFVEWANSKVTFAELDGVPVVTFYTSLMTPLDAALKRFIDIVISVVGLVLTVPLYPWIAWRIRSESPGPVIFKQRRVGENGRIFKLYKFRTMALDAEERKGELSEQNLMDGPMFKVEKDPRVFKFGAFLRRTSLDELPQFFNILRGDMSVVGTRPPTPDEVKRYETHYRRRLSIKPGLTGLWQVSGRNRINKFEDVLKLDLEYIDSWSIWLDLQIIARTVLAVVFGRGAC